MRRPLAVNAAASFPTVPVVGDAEQLRRHHAGDERRQRRLRGQRRHHRRHVVDPVDAEVALRPVVVAGGDERGALGPQA